MGAAPTADARLLRELEQHEAAHHPLPSRGVLSLLVNRTCWRRDAAATTNADDDDDDADDGGTHADAALEHLARALDVVGARLPPEGGGDGACDAARMVRDAQATLRRSGRLANSRAFFAVDALAPELRNRMLVLVGPGFRGRGGICASEAYEQLLRLRHELQPPPPPHPTPGGDLWAQVERTLGFFEVSATLSLSLSLSPPPHAYEPSLLSYIVVVVVVADADNTRRRRPRYESASMPTGSRRRCAPRFGSRPPSSTGSAPAGPVFLARERGKKKSRYSGSVVDAARRCPLL
jgi:hypothetical protein